MSSLVGWEGHFTMGAGCHENQWYQWWNFGSLFSKIMLVFSFCRTSTWRGENLSEGMAPRTVYDKGIWQRYQGCLWQRYQGWWSRTPETWSEWYVTLLLGKGVTITVTLPFINLLYLHVGKVLKWWCWSRMHSLIWHWYCYNRLGKITSSNSFTLQFVAKRDVGYTSCTHMSCSSMTLQGLICWLKH